MSHSLGTFSLLHRDLFPGIFKRLLLPIIPHAYGEKETKLARVLKNKKVEYRKRKYYKGMQNMAQIGIHPDMYMCYWLMRLAKTSKGMWKKVRGFIIMRFPKIAHKMPKFAAIVYKPDRWARMTDVYEKGLLTMIDHAQVSVQYGQSSTELISVPTIQSVDGVTYLDLYQGLTRTEFELDSMAEYFRRCLKNTYIGCKIKGRIVFGDDHKIATARLVFTIKKCKDYHTRNGYKDQQW